MNRFLSFVSVLVFSLGLTLITVTGSNAVERGGESHNIPLSSANKKVISPDQEEFFTTQKDEKENKAYTFDTNLNQSLKEIGNSLQVENELKTSRKGNMIYQVLQKLPLSHQKALQSLALHEEKDTTRGFGGKNTVILYMGSLSDEEIISVFIHEIGHVVDTGLMKGTSYAGRTRFLDGTLSVLSDDPSVRFYSFSWLSNEKKRSNQTRYDFVSGYAMTDPFEDFAESYLLYVLHGNTFRSMLPSSGILREKYGFLKEEVFDGLEFETDISLGNSLAREYDATLMSINMASFL